MDLFENPICARHCVDCEGMDHHWMADWDEETGDPIMVCKHCETTRPFRESDLDDML